MSTGGLFKMAMEVGEMTFQENPIDDNDNSLLNSAPLDSGVQEKSRRKHECAKCSLRFSTLAKLYHHKVNCTNSSSYKSFCWNCKKKFQFRIHFVKHFCAVLMQRRQRNKQLLRENLANAKGWVEEQKQKLVSEQREPSVDESENNDDNDIITCSKCDETFSSVQTFQFHYTEGLCKVKKLICEVCQKTFQDEDEFQFHEARCKDKERVMAKLKKKKLELKRLQQKLKENSTFTCRACKNKYYSPHQLKNHLEKHPYCIRIHNLKIKQRCMWERGDNLSKTARKSAHNYKKAPDDSYPIVKKLKQVKSHDWESESNTSIESYRKPVCGAARKSFPRPSSESKKGDFCDICYRYFSSFAELKSHKQKHYQSKETTKLNKCPQCPESFSDTHKLKLHQNSMDHWGKATKSITKTAVCPVCAKEFVNLPLRNAHLRSHMNEYPDEVKEFMEDTTCDVCFQIFASETSKIQHMRLKHADQASQKAEQPMEPKNDVEVIFQSHKYVGYSNKNVLLNVTPDISKLLKRHPNQCPICQKEYSTSFIRNRHFRTHTLDQAFECKFCPTKFPRSDRLMQHMQAEHNDSLAYECIICSLRFTTRMRALQHGSKAHPDMPAKNLIRERDVFINSFQKKHSKYAMAVNKNEAVIPDEEFYCDVCELSFLKLCGLQRHKQSKLHREIYEKSQLVVKIKIPELSASERPPLSITPPFIDYSKKITCSECSMDFDSVNDFVPHRLSHFSSQKPSDDINDVITYVCEVCGKVMDNHQRIQLHLFWHLQDVQLQAGPKKNNVQPKNSKTPVAKKSLAKSNNKDDEELVIAGVKKPLFTCEACKIGFITSQHYKIHIKQYCRSRKVDIESAEGNKPVNKCITAGFCKICGSIFSSSDLYEEHKKLFCNDNNFITLNDNAESLYTEMVKSLMKLDSMVAGCVRCNLAFDSMKMLAEHSSQHHVPEETDTTSTVLLTKLVPDSEETMKEDEILNLDEKNPLDDKQTIEPPKQLVYITEEDKQDLNITSNCFENTILELDISTSKITDNSASEAEESIMFTSDQTETLSNDTDEAEVLRTNFTRLLCVLVSDQDLMDQLGYGKKVIDDVLVNVLDQMGLAPVPLEEECTELDRLRRNIRILLDVCIKDQIMEFIANSETTTDSIVASALKMFNAEEPLSVLEEEL